MYERRVLRGKIWNLRKRKLQENKEFAGGVPHPIL